MNLCDLFLDVIPSLNVIERHLRDIAAFIISDTIFFENANIIAVMTKQ